MVLFIPANPKAPKASEKLLNALPGAIAGGYEAYKGEKEKQRLLAKEAKSKEALRKLGIPEELDPALQKVMYEQQLKNEADRELFASLGITSPSGSGSPKQQPGIPEATQTQKTPSPAAQQLLGEQPAQGQAPNQMLSPETAPDYSKTLEELQVPDEHKAEMAQALTLWDKMTPEQKTALAIKKPQVATILQRGSEHAQTERLAKQKFDLEKEKFEETKLKNTPEFKREERVAAEQAKADVEYNKQLQENAKQNELKVKTLDRLERLNNEGVTGKPFEKLLEKTGFVAYTSEGRREFAAEVKNLITDIRSILGAQFTGFEFQTILNAYPSADFSQEANAAIIKNLKDFQDIKGKEIEFANQLKKENKGKLPEDFQSKVNEKVHEYALSKVPEIKENIRKIMNAEYGIKEGHTLMFDNKGAPLSVPSNDVEKYKKLGAVLP